MELKDIKGIGKIRIKELESKGIFTPIDLLNVFPSKYISFSKIDGFSQVNEGETLTIKATMVEEAKVVRFKGNSYTFSRFLCSKTNKIFGAVWYGQAFMKNNLKLNMSYYLIGKTNKKKQLVVTNYYGIEKIESDIIPVYGKGSGLTKAVQTSAVKQILFSLESLSQIDVPLSGEKSKITTLEEAYREVHFPSSIENIEEAKKRIALEDLVLLAALEAEINKQKTKAKIAYTNDIVEKFKSLCPYNLTGDQEKVIGEIFEDLKSDKPMNRLLIGDVGSGKTIVAFFALYACCNAGHSGIMVAPTEILAKQHYENAQKLFYGCNNVNCRLLTSTTPRKEREEIICGLKSGQINVLISTHAAFNDKIVMPKLSLVITDEQHRFGVKERAILTQKNEGIDSLVMSATPIPRSLAIVLFGGLNVSEIKERPSGESKISTKLVREEKEEDMWNYLKKEVIDNAGKCFVVVPRIQNINEESSLYSTTDIYEKITKKYGIDGDIISIVHGKTDKEQAEKLIEEFKSGNKKILISTTIVEVGIDVKQANLMVIYNAERFGLATLHQLRGRIGRDGRTGYCFLMTENVNEKSENRLKLFKENNDGLLLAEEDLKLRGAGTLYGTQQHGTNEIFVNINFSYDEYKKAKGIYDSLEENIKSQLKEKASQKFGDIYKKIVLN